MYLDRFRAGDGPGLLLLHGYGNVLERTLGEGDTIQVEPGGFLYKDASVAVETVTHKLAPGDGQGSSAVQGAKSLASRGMAGLKALRALRKEGLEGALSGSVLQTASGRAHRSGTHADAAHRTGTGRHPVDVHGPRVGVMSDAHDHLRLSLLPDHLERGRPELPELRRPRRRGPPDDVGLDGAAGHSRHDPPADRPVVGADHGPAGPGGRRAAGRRRRGCSSPTRAFCGRSQRCRWAPCHCEAAGIACERACPVVMLEATGPGTISFSHDAPGEMVAIPLQAGAAVDVREHQLVVATRAVGYDWYDSGIWFSTPGGGRPPARAAGSGLLKMGLDLAGLDTGDRDDRRADEVRWVYPVGRQVDRFTAGEEPGLVLVQCGGNAFVRDLGDGESILVKPPALLFKDPTVGMELHVEFPAAGDTAVAHLGEPLPLATPDRTRSDRAAVELRAARGSRHRLPGEQPVHPAPLDLSDQPGTAAGVMGRPTTTRRRPTDYDRSRHHPIRMRYKKLRDCG